MAQDDSRTTSKDAQSKTEVELRAEEWWADLMKPSRRRKRILTSSQRKQQADLLRWLRNPTSDETWVGRDSDETPDDQPA